MGLASTPAAMAECSLDSEERKKLQRYLDVTKAQLFFAKGVILVEGISEALLLPHLAGIAGHSLDASGISVVNVQGLSFKPFAKLFNDGTYLIPAAILTDADRVDPDDEDSNTSKAAAALKQLEGGTLRVFTARNGFEWDLAEAGNAERMAQEYQHLRPVVGKRTYKAVKQAGNGSEKAHAFRSNGWRDRDKAPFAQRLAVSLAEDSKWFNVPEYIKLALNHVARKKNEGPG